MKTLKLLSRQYRNSGGFPITFSFCSLLRNILAIFQASFSLSLHLNV